MNVLDEHPSLEESILVNKMESFKIVTGGISHDFNNVLTMLFGHLALARQFSADDRLTGILDDAEKVCVRARDLTRQLLDLSRGGMPTEEVVDLPEIVRNIAHFTLKGTRAAFSFTASSGVWPVMASEARLSQVFVNLFLNAAQAMAQGGEITAGAENAVVKSGDGIPLPAGKYVRAWVKDEGVGIPARFIPRIFESGFSTKPAGNGFGLAISDSIIRDYGGCITVQSEEDRGALFSVYLPALSTKAGKSG